MTKKSLPEQRRRLLPEEVVRELNSSIDNYVDRFKEVIEEPVDLSLSLDSADIIRLRLLFVEYYPDLPIRDAYALEKRFTFLDRIFATYEMMQFKGTYRR